MCRYLKQFVNLILGISLTNCASTTFSDEELAKATIQQTTRNRDQLEAVISRFRTSDSLADRKLEAAYYLIANLESKAGYTVRDSSQFDSLLTVLSGLSDPCGWSEQLSTTRRWIDSIEKTRLIQIVKQTDIESIRADYLIANINDADSVWHQTPWHERYSYRDFWEWVLPYRQSAERLEQWRPFARTAIPIPDSVRATQDPVALGRYLITHTGVYFNAGMGRWPIPLTFSDMYRVRRGECYEMANYMLSLLRANGVPSSIDQIPVWANRSQAHAWPAIILPGNKSASLGYTPNGKNKVEYKISKIYRSSFAPLRNDLLYQYRGKEPIPSFFSGFDMLDVTREYDMPLSDLHISGLKAGRQKLVWLCTFDNRTWVPVAYTERKGTQATFKDIGNGILPDHNQPISFIHAGSGILYLPGYYNGVRIVPAADPVIVYEDGSSKSLIPDTTHTQSLTLYRKYPLNVKFSHYRQDMVGGIFQGANRADFSDADTLLCIHEPQSKPLERLDVSRPGKYRYVRYLAPKNNAGNVAELQFYSEGQRLYGIPIGLRIPHAYIYSPSAAFDDNMETFFETYGPSDSAWAGLDFGSPRIIDEVGYAARTDDNDIRIGDKYELKYWLNGEWHSAGEQVATTFSLTWHHLPSSTIYLLSNLSRGIEQRPFTYENEQQIWW